MKTRHIGYGRTHILEEVRIRVTVDVPSQPGRIVLHLSVGRNTRYVLPGVCLKGTVGPWWRYALY